MMPNQLSHTGLSQLCFLKGGAAKIHCKEVDREIIMAIFVINLKHNLLLTLFVIDYPLVTFYGISNIVIVFLILF